MVKNKHYFFKIVYISVWLLLLTYSAQGQSTDFSFGEEQLISSKILKESRKYWVSLPASYSPEDDKSYPVIYLLDADQNHFFQVFSGMLRQMAADSSPQIPEVILIGIVNENRVRDMSPTMSTTLYGGKTNESLKITGGATEFMQFIENELKSEIELTYKTSGYDIFIGYSFSGLPIMHTLFSKPNLFDGYIAIDPSVWWDNQLLLKQFEQFSLLTNLNNKRLFIASSKRVANVYPKANYVVELIKNFKSTNITGLSFDSKIFGLEENHQTMPILSFYAGIRFMFEGYMIDEEARFRPASDLKSHFTKLSEKLGTELKLSESLINWFAQDQLYNDQFGINPAGGIEFLKLNLYWYPNSVNAYINLGDGYASQLNYKQAISTYQKGLLKFPEDQNLRSKIQQIEQ